MAATKIRIDIVSDVVCPWCIIGYKQVERAIGDLGNDGLEIEPEFHWHPFELNSAMPPEGEDMAEHVARKYGSSPQQSAANRKRLSDMGDEVGFAFDLAPDGRIWNTFKAHCLLTWAGEAHGNERQTDLKLALFRAYFQQRRNVSDEAVLVDVAEAAGFDRTALRRALGDAELAQRVRAEEAHWIEQNVSGVPAIIFERKFMVPGAQAPDVFANVIRKIAEKQAA